MSGFARWWRVRKKIDARRQADLLPEECQAVGFKALMKGARGGMRWQWKTSTGLYSNKRVAAASGAATGGVLGVAQPLQWFKLEVTGYDLIKPCSQSRVSTVIRHGHPSTTTASSSGQINTLSSLSWSAMVGNQCQDGLRAVCESQRLLTLLLACTCKVGLD